MCVDLAEKLRKQKEQLARKDEAALRAVHARIAGASLRQCAEVAGVHVATLIRWAHANAWFRGYLLNQPRRRKVRVRSPALPTHPDCPVCGAPAELRTAHFGRRFWRCLTYPVCAWASWRPRHPQDCPECGAARYWSRRGQRITCRGCARASSATTSPAP